MFANSFSVHILTRKSKMKMEGDKYLRFIKLNKNQLDAPLF
jgi:hypothetical protein